MAKIGYARVSTKRQNLAFQIQALEEAGCSLIVAEKLSGRARLKPGLTAALASCQHGDSLVVWKLDRLGRHLFDLVELARLLKTRGVGLKVLTGRASMIDIATVEGRALYGIFAAFADLEHELGKDRASAGLRVARLKGAYGPRSRLRGSSKARAKRLRLRRAFKAAAAHAADAFNARSQSAA